MSRNTRIRIVFFAVALVVVAVLGWYLFQTRQVAAEHERIRTELVEAHEFEQAADHLEPLLDRWGSFPIHREIERTLATCYIGIGDDPGRPLRESARWYRKAQALDPGYLDDEHRSVIRAAE